MEHLVDIAKKFRNIYEVEKGNLELPCFRDFPKNCCEGASNFFAFYLMDKFPHKDVQVVHGTNEDNSENHFWVEVDGLIYDLTVDQFEEVDVPIYGVKSHPMSFLFPSTSEVPASCSFILYAENVHGFKKLSSIYTKIVSLLA